MARLVFYHHPRAKNFTLRYSSTSASKIRGRQKQSERQTKIIGYPFETPVYVLYGKTPEAKPAADANFNEGLLNEQIKELPRSGQVTAFRSLELFQAAINAKKGEEFWLYKEFEPHKIQQALNLVSWGASLPVVAGELMSNLILHHAMPNANHRTSIAMLQFAIESIEPSFGMPRTHIDDNTWQEWIDPYIVRSKEIITVRRNNVRFKYLNEANIDLIERKDGIQIQLDQFSLDMHYRQAQSFYAKKHEKHCTEFAKVVLERADKTDLLETTGPTRQEFVDYLESGILKRDLGEMF